MKIVFHKNFEKQYKRLPKKIKQKVKERNLLFERDEHDLLLNNHALHGKYKSYRSFSISGDLRIVYKFLDTNSVLFVGIGSHSDLYS